MCTKPELRACKRMRVRLADRRLVLRVQFRLAPGARARAAAARADRRRRRAHRGGRRARARGGGGGGGGRIRGGRAARQRRDEAGRVALSDRACDRNGLCVGEAELRVCARRLRRPQRFRDFYQSSKPRCGKEHNHRGAMPQLVHTMEHRVRQCWACA